MTSSRTRLPMPGDDPFLIMPENRFAYTAVAELRKRAASPPPPIYLYGPSGTGKSHLAALAKLFFTRLRPDAIVHRLLASEFAADLAEASEKQTIHEFRARFEGCQLFICEDLHALEGRVESQKQLMLLCDELLANHCQIVWTSRKAPGELTQMLPKLVSRFRGGVTAQVKLPARESRRKLIEHFAKIRQILLQGAAVELLAESLAVSPRELQAAVLQLEALARQGHQSLNVDVARRFLSQDTPRPHISLDEITRAVARQFGVSTKELRSRVRSQGVVAPRQCAMFLARELTDDSLQRIGKYFGDRDHSTVLHACQRVLGLLPDSPALRSQLSQVRSALGAPEPAAPSNETAQPDPLD